MIKSKKSMIIYFSKLSIGGMERALVDFIHKSNLRKNYNITLYVGYVLEQSYLDDLKKLINVKVICKGKWNLFSKIYSYFIMKFDILKNKLRKNKYDCSISYCYQHKIISQLARTASNNSIIFIHNDLIKCREEKDRIKMMKDLQFDKFNKVVCVSNCARESFKKLYPNYNGKLVTINNFVNGENIINKSKEKVDDVEFNKITFINIARHLEVHKGISKIIESTKLLKEEGYDFQVLLIGDGENHKDYIDLINKYNLNNYIKVLGSKLNPYKYLVRSDCLLFSSNFEGYGLVFDEARILNKPFITTDVADSKEFCKLGYGILVDNNIDSFKEGMKSYLDNGFNTKKFDYIKFNNIVSSEIDKIVK